MQYGRYVVLTLAGAAGVAGARFIHTRIDCYRQIINARRSAIVIRPHSPECGRTDHCTNHAHRDCCF